MTDEAKGELLPGFLEQACAEAHERVAEAARLVPLEALQRATAPPPRPLARAIGGAGVRVIAEIKRASPSAGHLAWVPDPAPRAHAYVAGGAAAVSVLTEPAHFRGTLADLTAVAAAVPVPVLRKDFVVEPYQVWEARAAGASAVLLIVAALDDATLVELLGAVADADLDALVEVHDETEAERAGRALDAARYPDVPIVGVNARDLTTLQVDHGRFAACVEALPDGALAVAESGVTGPDDVARAAEAGAAAVLVGEHLVTAADPEAAVRALLAAPGAAGPAVTGDRSQR